MLTSIWSIFSVIFILCVFNAVDGIKWLGMHKLRQTSPSQYTVHDCNNAKLNGLGKSQFRFCVHRQYSYSMKAVTKASAAVLYFCPHLFQDQRWDCNNILKVPHLTPDIKKPTREQAVVYAMSSVALLYEFTARCALTGDCECVPRPYKNHQLSTRDTFQWAGCSDAHVAGEIYVHEFVGISKQPKSKKKQKSRKSKRKRNRERLQQWDSPDTSARDNRVKSRQPMDKKQRRKLRRKVQKQNYKVGIQLWKKLSFKRCVCTGTSAQCTTKMCFNEPIRVDNEALLKSLKHSYMMAKLVHLDKGSKDLKMISYGNPQQSESISRTDLAYTEHSPDYCEEDPRVGSTGTRNRTCEAIPENTQSSTYTCTNMCCGRGYITKMVDIKYDCNCSSTVKLTYECKKCDKIQAVHYCK